MNTNPWLVDYAHADAEIDMYCFPYAGGGASSFRVMQRNLPREIGLKAIQIPGRENRIDESSFTNLHELAEAIVDALKPELKKRYAFYGHSMGAMLAFEVARALRRKRYRLPEILFVAAHRAPDLKRGPEQVHKMDDASVIEVIKRLKGTADSIIGDDRVMAHFLPAIRADFKLLETYCYVAESPLECRIRALGGISDHGMTAEDLACWGQHGMIQDFDIGLFPGGHFFHREHPEHVVSYITSQLARLPGFEALENYDTDVRCDRLFERNVL